MDSQLERGDQKIEESLSVMDRDTRTSDTAHHDGSALHDQQQQTSNKRGRESSPSPSRLMGGDGRDGHVASAGMMGKVRPSSRLFLGNLPSEKTSHAEIAGIFAKYGSIVEIILKSSFGFVQFDNPVSCQMAIQCENHRTLGDLKLDLKTSKDKLVKPRAEESTSASASTRPSWNGREHGEISHSAHSNTT
ncbi:hypothetical protein BASA60_001657, partial [Batrachochytrium salamandrivorans]